MNEQFILVAVRGTTHRPIIEGLVNFVQSQRTIAKKSGNWRGWKLQVRRKENYLKHPILVKKIKNKC